MLPNSHTKAEYQTSEQKNEWIRCLSQYCLKYYRTAVLWYFHIVEDCNIKNDGIDLCLLPWNTTMQYY